GFNARTQSTHLREAAGRQGRAVAASSSKRKAAFFASYSASVPALVAICAIRAWCSDVKRTSDFRLSRKGKGRPLSNKRNNSKQSNAQDTVNKTLIKLDQRPQG